MADIAVLNVYLHGRGVGAITRLPGDRHLFVFEDAYINDTARPTLSLAFKDIYGGLLTDVRPTQTRLPPFFSNLFPEGRMRDYLAARAGVNPEREFFLLAALGRDLPGALKVMPADTSGIAMTDPHKGRGERADATPLRFSLAGVQLKFSAVKEARGGLTIPAEGVGGSWIVKLPDTKFNGVPENEFAMMELARRVGIDVPETMLIPITDIAGLPEGVAGIGETAFVIRRFDRDDAGGAVHMEDFAQVFNVYPERKYENASYRNIAEVIWAEIGEMGIAEFIRRLTFNVLIGNGDMHLKNWSLIYPDGRTAALAPAYDFVSTIAYIKNDALALNFMGEKNFASLNRDQFARFAAKAKLPGKLVTNTVGETVDAFADAWRGANSLGLNAHVRATITAHLKTLPLWTG